MTKLIYSSAGDGNMQSVRLDYYNPKKTINVNPQNFTESILLAIDRFLIYLSQQRPNVLETYISDLTKFYGSAIPINYKNQQGFNRSIIDSSSSLLKKYPELIKVAVDLILSFLKLPEAYNWTPDDVSVLRTDVARARIIPLYYRAKMLAETIDRNDAIQLLKDYIDDAIRSQEVTQYDDLDSLYTREAVSSKENENSIWSYVKICEGKYASRTDRCEPYVVLKDYNDPELSYVVACYGDFTQASKFNDNFVMTRTTTLLNGPFCDTCFHDTRYVDKIEHPPMEFFEKL
jgi:hypothetical protein